MIIRVSNVDQFIKILKKNKCDFELLIVDTYNSEQYDKELLLEVTRVLHNLGIPSSTKGYQYIRSAIMMVYYNPSLIGHITKKLYYDLSSIFNTSSQRIERAIRHAIETSWNRGDIELMDSIFGHSIDIEKSKPTNSEFIITIADMLRIENIKVN